MVKIFVAVYELKFIFEGCMVLDPPPKKKKKKTELYLIIATFLWNFNDLDIHRKWLFFLIIVVKVLLVVAKCHYFLKRKFSEITKNRKFLSIFFLEYYTLSIQLWQH